MLYREFGATGEKIFALDFGCMRFPQVEGRIDEKAYIYHDGQSEPFVGKVLQSGYRDNASIFKIRV